MVEVGNGGDIPGVAGQGAREEAACVIDKMDDDDVDDFLGKFGGRRWACRRYLQRSIHGKGSPDSC